MKETVFHPSRSEMLSTDSRQKNRILFDAIRGEGVNRRGVCGEIEIDKSARNRVRRSRFGRDASMNSEMVSSEGRSRNEGCTTRALAGCRVGFVMRRFIECLLELCPVLEDND